MGSNDGGQKMGKREKVMERNERRKQRNVQRNDVYQRRN